MSSSRSTVRVAFLVVNYFSHSSVDQLLTSLSSANGGQVTVSIVDNSCDDREFADLARVISSHSAILKLQLSRAKENLGYAAGNNLAFASLDEAYDFVAVINPDVKLLSGDVSEAILESGPDVSNTIFVARTEEGSRHLSGISALKVWTGSSRKLGAGEEPTRHEIVYPDGHFMIFPSRMWRQLGGLDETYFLYCEEIDFTLRARRSGKLSIRILPNVNIQHVGGVTTGSATTKSLVTLHHSNRSRLIAYRTHSSLRRYFLPLVATRLAYAASLGLRAKVAPMRAVLSGLRSGSTAQVCREKIN